MRVLPVLEPRRAALETCVFCPKLCRSSCPVSNAEPRETVTPWGKMSLAWMAAHGDVPADRSHAAPAWACTGCFACRESCDHRNVVADTLLDARAALTREGSGPPGATRAIAGFARHETKTRAAVAAGIARHPGVRSDARVGLLVGCGYVRGAPREANDAVDAASGIIDAPVAIVDGCCGLPLRLAGDADGFAAHARAFARSLAPYDRVLVADAGCAMTLVRRYPDVGVLLAPRVETLAEAAASVLDRLEPVDRAEPEQLVRWHDPCQLGRGLGVYEAPRQLLTRALGRAPGELDACREKAPCSGAGGLLPSTMPDAARSIADTRLAVHARSGGGRVVTACASSLRALRRAAAALPSGDRPAVDDLVTWIARAVAAPRT